MKPGWYRVGGPNRYYRDEGGSWSVDRQDGSGVVPVEGDTPATMDMYAETGRLVPEGEGLPPDVTVFGTPALRLVGYPGYQHQGGTG